MNHSASFEQPLCHQHLVVPGGASGIGLALQKDLAHVVRFLLQSGFTAAALIDVDGWHR